MWRHLRSSVPRAGLRWRLLAPTVGLVAVAVLGLGLVGDFLARQHLEDQASRRGASVLSGVAQRLEERQRAKEVFARTLADDPRVVEAVERGNPARVAQVLVPLYVRLGIQWITVYSADGSELLRLGRREASPVEVPLKASALVGLTRSTTAAAGGITVAASSPLKSGQGIAGALVVGATLGGDAMREVASREGVELALFRDGSLVATTAGPELSALLKGVTPTPDNLAPLEHVVHDRHFEVAARAMPGDGLLVAMVPTDDLAAALAERNRATLLGVVLLLSALLVVSLTLAKDIAGPIEKVVATTRELERGNYQQRVRGSTIPELNNLACAINHLAEELEVQRSELHHRAFFDPLTRLPNRALFLDRLERALARADRRGTAVAILFLDLDNFKVINDSLGHQTGDELLVAIGERLRLCVRDEDTVARLGGDEFTVLLEDIREIAEATEVADRIAERLQRPFTCGGRELFASTSIGIAVSEPGHHGPGALLRDADLAMYRAKTNGKAGYVVFDRGMGVSAMERLELESELRRAIEREELRVHYQPIVDLATGKVVEVEALVRWQHPRLGLVPPARFIPLAEETGLILPVGLWVLEEACRQMAAWHAQHLVEPPLFLSVNLSARQVQHTGLVDEIAAILGQTQLDPGSLKLEITESVLMQNVEGTMSALLRLKDLGLRLAVDDFGTGYSSLAYLKRFPVDILKIDRSFVDGLGRDHQDTVIVRNIVEMAKSLGLGVTGEGIETADQLAYLRELGCDQGQGYLFAKPLPAGALGELLRISPSLHPAAEGSPAPPAAVPAP